MRKADLTTILGHRNVIWEPYLPETLWAPRACVMGLIYLYM